MKKYGRTWQQGLPLCSAAGILVMLLLLWPAMLLPEGWRLFGAAISQLAGLAVLLLLGKRLLPQAPQDGQAAALPARSLLTGDMQVKCVMAPEVRLEPMNVKAGSSMMLCLHAAALLPGRDEREEAALLRGLKLMKADPARIAEAMPLLATAEAKGLVWQIHRDGRSSRAFACGTPEQILPICGQMISRRPLPLTEALRSQLMIQLQAQALPPLCFAMAQRTEEGIGEPVYLGAFLFEEELAPDASQQIAALRRLGLRPFAWSDEEPELAAMVNRRLGCDAESLRCAFRYEPEGTERLTHFMERRSGLSSRMDMFVIQAFLLLQLITVGCLAGGLDPFCLILPGFTVPLWFPLCFSPEEGPMRRLLPGDMLRFLFSALIAVGCMLAGGLFAEACHMNAATVALAILTPWLCRCAWQLCGQTGSRPVEHRAFAAAVTGCIQTAGCIGAGISLLGLGFGLALGGFGMVLGYLLSQAGKHHKNNEYMS